MSTTWITNVSSKWWGHTFTAFCEAFAESLTLQLEPIVRSIFSFFRSINCPKCSNMLPIINSKFSKSHFSTTTRKNSPVTDSSNTTLVEQDKSVENDGYWSLCPNPDSPKMTKKRKKNWNIPEFKLLILSNCYLDSFRQNENGRFVFVECLLNRISLIFAQAPSFSRWVEKTESCNGTCFFVDSQTHQLLKFLPWINLAKSQWAESIVGMAI